MDLLGKVVHTFLNDLPDDRLEELPADMEPFADREQAELSYEVAPEDAPAMMETLAEYAGWLVDGSEQHEGFNDLASFGYLQRVLDEQCYRLPELEADEEADIPDDDDDDDDPRGWEPIRSLSSNLDDVTTAATDEATGDDDSEPETDADDSGRVELRDPDEIGSDSLQNPHDQEATYQRGPRTIGTPREMRTHRSRTRISSATLS